MAGGEESKKNCFAMFSRVFDDMKISNFIWENGGKFKYLLFSRISFVSAKQNIMLNALC